MVPALHTNRWLLHLFATQGWAYFPVVWLLLLLHFRTFQEASAFGQLRYLGTFLLAPAGWLVPWAVVKNLVAKHFYQETGEYVADIDLGTEATVSRYVPAEDAGQAGGGVATEYARSEETVDRRDFELEPSAMGSLIPAHPRTLQDVLNRHWAFHSRQFKRGKYAAELVTSPILRRGVVKQLAAFGAAVFLALAIGVSLWYVLAAAACLLLWSCGSNLIFESGAITDEEAPEPELPAPAGAPPTWNRCAGTCCAA